MATSRQPSTILARTGLRVAGRPALVASAIALGMMTGALAVAQGYATRDVGGWTVAVSKDRQGCFLTRQYDRPGETTLLLGLELDGTNHLSVLNANWSIKPKDALQLTFRLSTGGYAKHAAVGLAADGKQGFVTAFEAKFPAYFAASKILHVARGKMPVEQLNLAGSGAAVVELRRCVWILRTKSGGGTTKKDRAGDIPIDPFASDDKR